jgi:hypothetical protein
MAKSNGVKNNWRHGGGSGKRQHQPSARNAQWPANNMAAAMASGANMNGGNGVSMAKWHGGESEMKTSSA